MLDNKRRNKRRSRKQKAPVEDHVRIERTLQLLQNRLPKVEQKYYSQVGNQTSLSWNGALQSPNTISQGTGENSRVGSSVVQTHQRLRSQLSQNSSSVNAYGTTAYQQIRLILFFQIPTISSPSTATMSNYLLSTPQLPESINSQLGQQYRQDFVVLCDRVARVSANEPVVRMDFDYKMNQAVHWIGGSTTNIAHGLQWLVLTDATPAQLNFPQFYWTDLLAYRDQ